jgi:hypothetical protein
MHDMSNFFIFYYGFVINYLKILNVIRQEHLYRIIYRLGLDITPGKLNL